MVLTDSHDHGFGVVGTVMPLVDSWTVSAATGPFLRGYGMAER